MVDKQIIVINSNRWREKEKRPWNWKPKPQHQNAFTCIMQLIGHGRNGFGW